MNAELDDYENGYYGVSIQLRMDEIDQFIELLKLLKQEKPDFDHFHMARKDIATGIVYDIEFSLNDEAEEMAFL